MYTVDMDLNLNLDRISDIVQPMYTVDMDFNLNLDRISDTVEPYLVEEEDFASGIYDQDTSSVISDNDSSSNILLQDLLDVTDGSDIEDSVVFEDIDGSQYWEEGLLFFLVSKLYNMYFRPNKIYYTAPKQLSRNFRS